MRLPAQVNDACGVRVCVSMCAHLGVPLKGPGRAGQVPREEIAVSASCSLLGILLRLKFFSFPSLAPCPGEFQHVLLISRFPPELDTNAASPNFHPPEPAEAELQSPRELSSMGPMESGDGGGQDAVGGPRSVSTLLEILRLPQTLLRGTYMGVPGVSTKKVTVWIHENGKPQR